MRAPSMEFTRFERARLLGARALQIAMGAPPILRVPSMDPLGLATAELEGGVLPMQVQRPPHGRH